MPNPAEPGYSPDDPLIIDPGWGRVRRVGEWVIPPYLNVRGSAGWVLLDCALATPHAGQISVDLAGGMGTITFVLPEGWGVDTSRLAHGLGMCTVKTTGRRPGAPMMYVSGHLLAGWLTIRNPSWNDRRRHRKLRRTAPITPSPRPPQILGPHADLR